MIAHRDLYRFPFRLVYGVDKNDGSGVLIHILLRRYALGSRLGITNLHGGVNTEVQSKPVSGTATWKCSSTEKSAVEGKPVFSLKKR